MTQTKTPPALAALFASIREVLDKDKDTKLADLAKHLGRPWSQVHEWVIRERVLPNGEVTLGMVEWLAQHQNLGGDQVTMTTGKSGAILKMKEDGRRLTEFETRLWMENNALRQLLRAKL